MLVFVTFHEAAASEVKMPDWGVQTPVLDTQLPQSVFMGRMGTELEAARRAHDAGAIFLVTRATRNAADSMVLTAAPHQMRKALRGCSWNPLRDLEERFGDAMLVPARLPIAAAGFEVFEERLPRTLLTAWLNLLVEIRRMRLVEFGLVRSDRPSDLCRRQMEEHTRQTKKLLKVLSTKEARHNAPVAQALEEDYGIVLGMRRGHLNLWFSGNDEYVYLEQMAMDFLLAALPTVHWDRRGVRAELSFVVSNERTRLGDPLNLKLPIAMSTFEQLLRDLAEHCLLWNVMQDWEDPPG